MTHAAKAQLCDDSEGQKGPKLVPMVSSLAMCVVRILEKNREAVGDTVVEVLVVALAVVIAIVLTLLLELVMVLVTYS